MSLRSTRKRLKDYVELLKYGADKVIHSSIISKFGKNPGSQIDLLKLQKKIEQEKNSPFKPNMLMSARDKEVEKRVEENNRLLNSNQNYIEKEEINRAKNDAFKIQYNDNAKNYRDKIKFSDNKDNINIREKEYKNNVKAEKKEKKKINFGFIITMILVELVTLGVIFAVGFFIRFNDMKQVVEFNKSEVHNTNISETHLKAMEGFRTIAVFGLDSRTGSVSKGNNADVNIIVNINLGTGEVKLVSVYRDLYLNINDNNGYGKLNAAYSYGGPERSVKALNKNFDLDITNYASFNWKAVANVIDLLGGIDLEIEKKEYKYMNAFIHETCIATGTDSKNPALHYISSSGYQHLDGVQAVAYARLRLMDSDFQRVERQKKVIELCLQKAKKLSIDNLIGIASETAQMISFDVDWAELISLIKNIDNVKITETTSFPPLNRLETIDMGSSGNCVVPKTLEKAVVELHQFLYNEENYETSKAVKTYSNRIIELRNKYEEENKIKESIRQSEEESREAEEKKKGNVIKKKTNKASESNIEPKTEKTAVKKDKDGNVIPNIFDEDISDTYEEEPFDDEQEGDEIIEVEDPNAPGSSNRNTDKTNSSAPYSSGRADASISDGPPGSRELTPQGPPGSGESISQGPPGIGSQTSSSNQNNNGPMSSGTNPMTPMSPTPINSNTNTNNNSFIPIRETETTTANNSPQYPGSMAPGDSISNSNNAINIGAPPIG